MTAIRLKRWKADSKSFDKYFKQSFIRLISNQALAGDTLPPVSRASTVEKCFSGRIIDYER